VSSSDRQSNLPFPAWKSLAQSSTKQGGRRGSGYRRAMLLDPIIALENMLPVLITVVMLAVMWGVVWYSNRDDE
jgi:hypothetical protein